VAAEILGHKSSSGCPREQMTSGRTRS